jgi:hypothetical protein
MVYKNANQRSCRPPPYRYQPNGWGKNLKKGPPKKKYLESKKKATPSAEA